MATKTKKFENLEEGTVIAAVSPGAGHIAYFTTLDSDGTLTFELEGMTGETTTIDLKTTENKFSKTIASIIIGFVFIIGGVLGVFIFNVKEKSPLENYEQSEQYWNDMGVGFVSAEEAKQITAALEHTKGGVCLVASGSKVVVDGGTINYHEAEYGGAFYVEDNDILEINGKWSLV
jgi:hypothetical protein